MLLFLVNLIRALMGEMIIFYRWLCQLINPSVREGLFLSNKYKKKRASAEVGMRRNTEVVMCEAALHKFTVNAEFTQECHPTGMSQTEPYGARSICERELTNARLFPCPVRDCWRLKQQCTLTHKIPSSPAHFKKTHL